MNMIYQLVSSFSYGDAIGNDVLAIDRYLKQKGYATQIMALMIDDRLKAYAKYYSAEHIGMQDTVIYHKAAGDPMNRSVQELQCTKIMLYHNITPESFFKPYDRIQAWRLRQGRAQVQTIVPYLDYAWADSSYNLQELLDAGMDASRTAVLPIILDFEQYNQSADTGVLQCVGSREGTKLLFTGRIAPNKCQEDIIKVFYYYKNFVDSKAQLYLVGSFRGMEKYYSKLQGFVAELGLKDVYFTGHVSFQELLAYYQACDVFVCMSEHEGFCVPLVECMYFNMPIVAYASSAIPETLAGSGVLLQEKDYGLFCDAIKRLQQDTAYRQDVIDGQREALNRYQQDVIAEQLYVLLDTVIQREM